MPSHHKPLLLITGASGVGKNSVTQELIKHYPQLEFIVSATTRWPARAKERFAQDYYFIDQERFDWLKNSDQLIENTSVYGDQYGTLKFSLERALNSTKTPILTVDPQGVENYHKLGYSLKIVYLDFPNAQAQRQRIVERQPDINPETLDERLAQAANERAWAAQQTQEKEFKIVINDRFTACVQDCAEFFKLNETK